MNTSEDLGALSALQRKIKLNRRRGRRSEVVYVNAFIRSTSDPLEVLTDEAILRNYCLNRAIIMELVEFAHPHLVRPNRRNFAPTPTVKV